MDSKKTLPQMKKLLISSLFFCTTLWIAGQIPLKKSETTGSFSDKMSSYPASSTVIGGYLGDKINLVIDQRIKSQDVEQLVEPFRHKEETHLWQDEFWGKWILSAIASYDYNKDPGMLAVIKDAVHKLLATQM